MFVLAMLSKPPRLSGDGEGEEKEKEDPVLLCSLVRLESSACLVSG